MFEVPSPEDWVKLAQTPLNIEPYRFTVAVPVPALVTNNGDAKVEVTAPPLPLGGEDGSAVSRLEGRGQVPASQPTQMGRFYRLSQLATLPAPTWLIDSILPQGSVTMVAGPPKSLKSFLALDWILTLVIGREWHGHATNPKGTKVVYILGEGKSNLAKRIKVWVMTHHLSQEELQMIERNFVVSFTMPQLRQSKSVDTLIKDLNNEGITNALIVLDTLARAMVGADENAVKDTGEAVAQMDRLRDKGFTVMFLHHTVKNVGKKGAIFRGSSNLEAAIDTSFDVYRNRDSGEMTLRNSNQKDDEEAAPMKFGWEKIYLDLDQKVSSLVLYPLTEVPVEDQILALPLPLSRDDIKQRVKGFRHDKVLETLDLMLSTGKVVEAKQGRRHMIERPTLPH